MIDDKDLLERASAKVAVPERVMADLLRRRARRERNRRISAAVVALMLVTVSVAGLMWAFGARGETPATQTPTPDRGIFAGLGGWIAYQDDPNGIGADDPQHPERSVQISTKNGQPLAWSSDGSKLLVVRQNSAHFDLFELGSDGSTTQVVRGSSFFGSASLSPDGSKVVYGKATGSSGTNRIYVVELIGGIPTRISPRGLIGHDPVFSPDGSKIAYFQGGGDFDNTLSVMNADGSGSHRVLRADMLNNSLLGSLAWFPDGRRLLFLQNGCDSAGKNWIYTVNADGSGLTRLAKGFDPILSPDGSQVAYATGRCPLDPSAVGASASLMIETIDGRHIQPFQSIFLGPWNPLPRSPSGTQSASVSHGATRADWITYSILSLIALGFVLLWFRRKRRLGGAVA
jgi:Tol biopolymer transport system component